MDGVHRSRSRRVNVNNAVALECKCETCKEPRTVLPPSRQHSPMKRFALTGCLLAVACLALPSARPADERAALKLTDPAGKSHDLHAPGAKAVVLFFPSTTCPSAGRYLERLV